jgi:hypothetical protein
MVKLSRKGARSKRSLKNRSSRKRLMKGGAWVEGTKNYNRIKNSSILYELSISDTSDGKKVYTLDFSKVGRLGSAMMKTKNIFGNFVGEKLDDTYSKVFIEAFGITDDSSKTNVIKVMKQLFATGVDGAKEKKLIITESSDTVDIELVLVNGGKETIRVNSKFEDYLKGLGDGIMPIPPSQ